MVVDSFNTFIARSTVLGILKAVKIYNAHNTRTQFNLHIHLTYFTIVFSSFITFIFHVIVTGVYTYCDDMGNHVRNQYYQSYLYVKHLTHFAKA